MGKMTLHPFPVNVKYQKIYEQPNLPPLDDVLAELNEGVSTGQITFAGTEEALKDYGQTQE